MSPILHLRSVLDQQRLAECAANALRDAELDDQYWQRVDDDYHHAKVSGKLDSQREWRLVCEQQQALGVCR